MPLSSLCKTSTMKCCESKKEIKRVTSVQCFESQEFFPTGSDEKQLGKFTRKQPNCLLLKHQLQTNASIRHHSSQRRCTKRDASKINQARHLVSSPAGTPRTTGFYINFPLRALYSQAKRSTLPPFFKLNSITVLARFDGECRF